MAKNIYSYRDAEGFLPEDRFDQWCKKNHIQREPDNLPSPRWDGLYTTKMSRWKSSERVDYYDQFSQSYMRFYPDRAVLFEAATMNSPTPGAIDMARVFNKEEKVVKSRANYKLRGEQIAFEVDEFGPPRGLLRLEAKSRRPFLGIRVDNGETLKFADPFFIEQIDTYTFTPVPAFLEEHLLSHTPPAASMKTPLLSAPAQKILTQLKGEGIRHIDVGHYDLALPIYEQIIQINPADHNAHFYMGICLSNRDSNLALVAYEQACRLSPRDSTYHRSRASKLWDLAGKFWDLWYVQEALNAFELSLQVAPHKGSGSYAHMEAWEGISKTLQKLGRTGEAQAAERIYEQSRSLFHQQASTYSTPMQAPMQAPMQTSMQAPIVQRPVTQMTEKIGTLFTTYQQPSSKVDGLAWSPDGSRLASFGLGEAQVWVPLSGSILYNYRVKGFATIITGITWSPDATRIATASSDKLVQIWDAKDGHSITTYKGHQKVIRCLSWSPNGQSIASCEDCDLRIWNAVSGQDILTFTVHPKTLVGVRSLAWSPDATRIATGGGNDRAVVWNPNDGSEIYTYKQQYTTFNGLAWSPDGKRIVSGCSDKTVQIWTAETGADPVVCKGHTKAVHAVAFSPDGKRIASASDDTTVCIWDSETGQQLFAYEGHKKGVSALAWSPDGKYLASGGVDRTVQVWAC